jgi:hypothetical protein
MTTDDEAPLFSRLTPAMFIAGGKDALGSRD